MLSFYLFFLPLSTGRQVFSTLSPFKEFVVFSENHYPAVAG
ncbi:MAG: hypothetical protein Q8N69_01045 [bacterium]|nr:hypothetical protein [bacterium]